MLNAAPNDTVKHQDLAETLSLFYSDLSINGLTTLGELYSKEVVFIDPVGTHVGLASLIQYFTQLLTNCSECRCVIKSQLFGTNSGSIEWSMSFVHPRINKGEVVQVNGMSLLKIQDNKIIYQRDFYDLAAMIYEHLPIIGAIIKQIRKRMA